jgi:DNA repair protein RecN (Recombination protein N)
MLRTLTIRNLAVIQSAEVEFADGLTVLSGETGTGKSILLEAIELLLGGRASSDLVRTGEPAAVVEGRFETSFGPHQLKREVSAAGRSRGFIDGASAGNAALRALAPSLVEIQGQHQHLALLDPSTHLGLIDAFGGASHPVASVAACWTELRRTKARFERSLLNSVERERRLDTIAQELKEIRALDPKPGEMEALTDTRGVLFHADRIQSLSEEAYEALYGSDDAAMAKLSAVWKRVAELAELDPRFRGYHEARDTIKSQLEDLSEALRDGALQCDGAATRLEVVESRLASLERLQRKYGPSLEDVLARAAHHRDEEEILSSPEGEAPHLRDACAQARLAYLSEATALSGMRCETAAIFSHQLAAVLHRLAMTDCRVEVRFNDAPLGEYEWSERGIDSAELFLSANLGEAPRPLASVISGGELSRAALALRWISASACEGRTLIFDEVDAGIGGRTADVVGRCLRELADRFQVICITHVPQIAAYADHQLRVVKHTEGGRTMSRLDPLDEAGRIEELARMLAGASVTRRALEAAEELLQAASSGNPVMSRGESKYKTKAKA